MSKATEIIARFTSDPALTKTILGHVEGVRSGTKTIHQCIAEHTSDPKIEAKVYEVIKRIKSGHSIHSVAAYHAPDANVAHGAADTANRHHGVIQSIIAR